MPPDLVDALKPEYVAPLVGYLCHESCQTTGGVFEVGAGWTAALRRQRTKGKLFPLSRDLLPEDIRNNWNVINDFTEGEIIQQSPQDAFSVIMDQLNKEHPSVPAPKHLRFDGKVVFLNRLGGFL